MHKLTCVQREVSLANNQVSKATIEIGSLRNLSNLYQLREMVNFSSNGEVVVSEFV